MRGKIYSDEFKKMILREVEEVKNIPIVAKKHDLPFSTVHTWIYRSKNKVDFKRKKENLDIISENKNLKKQLSEKEAKINILEDLLKKTYQVWVTN